MKAKELNELLLLNIPDLKEKFEEVTSWQDGIDTGSFIVFEDVLMVKLEEYILLNDSEKIEKCYKFIEKISFIDDEYVRNVLNIAILENINSFIDNTKFVEFLKPNSKELYNEMYKL